MEIETSIPISATLPLERFAEATRRSCSEVLLRAARGVVKYAIRLTPPFSSDGGPNAPTNPAFQRGKGAITRDLKRHFRPVQIRGIGPGAQDPVAIYLRLIRSGRKRFGRPLQRDQAAPFFVDATRLRSLERIVHSKVGKLAAGWMPAALALQATGTPAWISRHGAGRGSVDIDVSGPEANVTMINDVGRFVPASELQRRANAALYYQGQAMQRELMGYLSRQAVAAGLATNISAGSGLASSAA